MFVIGQIAHCMQEAREYYCVNEPHARCDINQMDIGQVVMTLSKPWPAASADPLEHLTILGKF